MWKRTQVTHPVEPPAAPHDPSPLPVRPPAPVTPPPRPLDSGLAHLGKSVVIKGELTGSEDLTIEGRVEGKIELHQHLLTIGANGQVKAQVVAKSVVVLGQVTGNIAATDKVEIREHGSVEGDITSPRVAIAEGAHFRGSIDMQGGAKNAQAKATTSKPDTSDAPTPITSVPAARSVTAPVAAAVRQAGELQGAHA